MSLSVVFSLLAFFITSLVVAAHGHFDLEHVLVLELEGRRVARLIKTFNHLWVNHSEWTGNLLSVLLVEAPKSHLGQHWGRLLLLGHEVTSSALSHSTLVTASSARWLSIIAEELWWLGSHS